ncbi:siroheme synthase CysG [Jannaschia sp. LMIT008]|uniref:siroheme synthase CysG n=1 Tax=Jannaschia maritima TaxID=3032585 RepID=UPI002812107F|nr:siroheme synthase CysG [Jannaschia sp. LMIT008]
MKSFPMFLALSGRRVVIAGGGEAAAQKMRLMLKTEARIEILAPAIDEEIAAAVAAGRAVHRTGPVSPAAFEGAALVFVCTGSPGADACLHALAKEAGALVNVVDRPALCDATTPSIVDRDPVVVAIGTEGTAPVLARRIKTEIEGMLDPRLGAFAALAGRLRTSVARHVAPSRRRAFWAWAMEGPWQRFRSGAERETAAALKAAIRAGGPDEEAGGRIDLVGAGPGARDLLTMRAVRRLQEADVIFYDRLVDPDVLELARRDAERVFAGKATGAHAWPQERIDRAIVAEARKGRRVVRLKSGDPSIFGRASEEMAAAEAAGIPCEIIPGVTAASAAAAALGRPLTERGETDRLVIATGTCRLGDADPDWAAMLSPGTTLALYMAAGRADEIATILRDAGLPGSVEVEIAGAVTTRRERLHRTDLASLGSEPIDAPALLLLRHSKRRAIDSQAA